jgi:hypothetical protein
MSMPVARPAPKSLTAEMAMRPSPEPRSYTMSPLVTFAVSSIAFTTSGGVGTKMTSGDRSGACVCCASDGATKSERARASVSDHEDRKRVIAHPPYDVTGRSAYTITG